MRQHLSFFLLLMTLLLSGQSRINKMHPSFGGFPEAAILVQDSGYIVGSANLFNWSETIFGRFDLEGNLVKQKSFIDTYYSKKVACSKCFYERNGTFYFAQTSFGSQNSSYVQFWKLDQYFDSVYTKKHLDFETGDPFIKDMQFDTDSTFIVSGHLYRGGQDEKYDLWVAKFDTAFNVIWENRVIENTPGLYYGYDGDDLTVDAYGSILVSGRVRLLNNGTQVYVDKTAYARFNRSTGDLMWIKEFDQAPGSANMATLDEGNGTYRFAQLQYLSVLPRTRSYADSTQIRFGLLDTLGYVVWDTLIGPKHSQFWFRDMQRTMDGNYYLAGGNHLHFAYASAGFKISPRGDSLWFRNYVHLDTSSDRSHIMSFQPTPDSGFVHFGYYIDWDNDLDSLRRQYSWLLKTDKYGCPVEDCQSISLPEEQLADRSFSLYPNPTTGMFYLNIPEDYSNRATRLNVFNGSGQAVLHRQFDRPPTASISLAGLPAGLYFVQISVGGEPLGTQKIILKT